MSHYIPFITDDGYHIGVMKSSSATPADADWDNQDNVILLAGQSKVKSLWSFEDGGDYHIATQQENGRVAYHVFDPVTDAFLTRDEFVVAADATPPTDHACGIALRADGDVLIFYMDGAAIDLAHKESGTWTTNVEIEAASIGGLSVIGPDSSDRITAVYADATGIRTRSVASDNSLGTETTVDAAHDDATFVVGPGVIDSANLITVPYIDVSNDVSTAQWTSAAAPTPINIKADVSDKNVVGHGTYTTQEQTARNSSSQIAGATGTNEKQAQSFQADGPAELQSLTLSMSINNSPTDNLEISIQTDSSGEPSGTKLATVTVAASDLPGPTTDVRFALQTFIGSGITHWIVGERSGARDTTNVVVLGHHTAGTYSNGSRSHLDSGSWVNESANDVTFSIDDVNQIGPVACLALDGTDVHLIYSDDDVTTPTLDLFHDDDASVAGGGTETEVEDAVTAIRVSMAKGTTDLLYCFDDNGTLKFAQITLGGTGVTITVPAPKAFSLTGQLPIVGTGVQVDTPVPEAFTLAGQLPIVGTGVIVTTPAPNAFTLAGQEPITIETGVTIVTPTPKTFTLAGQLPTIETGVTIVTPAPRGYTLAGQLPAVGTGVIVTTPVPKAFTLNGFDPVINIGVNVINPLGSFTLAGQLPIVGTAAEVIVPVPKAFTITGQIPIIGTGVDVTVPAPTAFTLAGFDPVINIGVNVINPLGTFTLTGQDPTIETGASVLTPLGTFTLTGQLPTIETGVTVITPAPKSYTLTGFDPAVSIGLNVTVPAPKAFTLAGQLPAAGTSVLVITPAPNAFTLTGFDPVITTGEAVDVIVPAPTAFTLAGQLPIVGTGVDITNPLGTFTLAGQLPIVGSGASVALPAPKLYTLSGLVPRAGTSVLVDVPSKVFTISGTFETGGPIPVVESFTNADGGNDFTRNIIKPSGVVETDLLLCLIVLDNDGDPHTITAPSDTVPWVQLENSGSPNNLINAGLFYKVVTATAEPASYTWTFSRQEFWGIHMMRISGVDITDPINAHSFAINNSQPGTPTPSDDFDAFLLDITCSRTNCLLIHHLGSTKRISDSIHAPGLLETVTVLADYGGSAGVRQGAAWEPFATGGETGDRLWHIHDNIAPELQERTTALLGIQPAKLNDSTVPIVGSGASVASPSKAFTLAGLIPRIGTSALVVTPVPKAFTLAGQLPTIETGVAIITPLGTFTLTTQLPIVGTGVIVDNPLGTFTLAGQLPIIGIGTIVTTPAPKAFTLTGFDPVIAIGVNVINPLGTFTLAGQLPIVGTGVIVDNPLGTFTITGFLPTIDIEVGLEVIVPLGTFTLAGQVPSLAFGVNVITPAGSFILTGQLPTIETGVAIITPLGTFTLAGQLPIVGSGVNIVNPLKTFTLNNFAPAVASGVGIPVPLQTYTLTGFTPIIGISALITVPTPKVYTLTGFDPVITLVHEIKIPLHTFTLTGFSPDILSNRPLFAVEGANNLDLTPPWEDIDKIRYLFKNFAILRNLLEDGTDGQFTTSDGKTALVRGGIIIDLF